MDALVEKCLKCGKPLQTPRKLKDFCSYSCRGQHAVDTLDGTKYRTGLSGSRNLKKNRALRTLKQQGVGAITFCKINAVTYRVDRRNKNGAGWLMEVAWPSETRQQRWVARVCDRASEPLPLEEAKKAATAMLDERGRDEQRDWIRELDQIATNEVDRVVIEREKRKWPVDLIGGSQRGAVDPELRRNILDAEIGFIEEIELIPSQPSGWLTTIALDADEAASNAPPLSTPLDRRRESIWARARPRGPLVGWRGDRSARFYGPRRPSCRWDQKAVVASYYGMSSKADYYRTRAEESYLKATIAEDMDRRFHWLEAAAPWLSFGRQEGATLSQRPADWKHVERCTANISGLLVMQCSTGVR